MTDINTYTHQERFGQSPKLSIMDYRGEIGKKKRKIQQQAEKWTKGPKDFDEGSVFLAN